MKRYGVGDKITATFAEDDSVVYTGEVVSFAKSIEGEHCYAIDRGDHELVKVVGNYTYDIELA